MAILVAEIIRIAETGRTTSTSPLARALADLRKRLDHLTTATSIARWVQSMKGYLGYQVWEAAYRYLSLREQTIARVGPDTQRYIGGLLAWIRGNLDWSVDTARYRRSDRPTIRVVDGPNYLVPGPRFDPSPGIAWWWDELKASVAA